MAKKDISNKKIELFVDNGIDKYRKEEDITINEMLDVFFENNGFFVLEEEDHKIIGYLDMADFKLIREIIENMKEDKKVITMTLKDYIMNKGEINFRKETIPSDKKVLDVLKKLDKSEQNYFPVVKEDILIGRVSKRILKEKIDALYN